MPTPILVLGATGSIGYAMTRHWLQAGQPVTAVVRQPDQAKRLLGHHPLLTIRKGDLTQFPDLASLLRDHPVIFHGINYPYHLWQRWMVPITRDILSACAQSGATLLFPGNHYEFGLNLSPITEKTPPAPIGPKGRLRLTLYQLLRDYSQYRGGKVIYLRLPDVFGPNVTNGLLNMLFGNAIKGKNPTWPICVHIPHQFAYTPDVAAVFYHLAQHPTAASWVEWNYGGHIISSIQAWVKLMGRLQQRQLTAKPIPKAILYAMGWFNPVLKELRENFYQFEHTIILDDNALQKFLKNLPLTPLEVATRQTLTWFQQHLSLWNAAK